MSKKKSNSPPDDLFRSIPPQEQFFAFPSMDAFPKEAIAFLTGKSSAPINEQPHKSYSRPHSKPVSKPESKPVSKPLNQSASQKVNQSASQKVNQSASQSIGQTQGQSLDQTQGQSLDQTQGQSLDQTQDQTLDLSLNQPSILSPFLEKISLTPLDKLNSNQRKVLDYLLRAKPEIIKMAHIAHAVALRENTTRTIMRRLAALDFLTFKKARDGNIQGVRIAFNHPQCTALSSDERYGRIPGQTLSQTPSQTISQTPSQTISQTPSQTISQTLSQTPSQTISQTKNNSNSQQYVFSPSKIDRKDSFYLEGENQENDPCLDSWTDDLLATMWPKVFEAGFRLEHLRRVLAARVKIGKTLDRDMLTVSLDRADWELERFGRLTDLGSGEKVKNPQAYLFTALARWGALRPHPDYVSREEVEAEAAAREIERRRKAAKLVEEALFASWREALDPAELEDLLRACPGGPKDVWLKNHWRTHVRPAKDAGA